MLQHIESLFGFVLSILLSAPLFPAAGSVTNSSLLPAFLKEYNRETDKLVEILQQPWEVLRVLDNVWDKQVLMTAAAMDEHR